MQEPQTVLDVQNLKTYFFTDLGVAQAVDGVSFSVYPGKTLALVGESGCGKSVTAMSILGLVPRPPGKIVAGSILYGAENLVDVSEKRMRQIRGHEISMVFQEPMTAMNPVFKIGQQMSAIIQMHLGVGQKEARDRAVSMLDKVGIPSPERRIEDYPHQLSGGMLQRVMIAMSLSCEPKLLIADEPTTGIDVTIQAQILALLKNLQAETGMSILLITHDMGVVAEIADEVAVMYAGQIVEHSPINDLFDNPLHPYTRGLFASLPGMHQHGDTLHTIKGIVPAATAFPEGCRFHPRCPYADRVPHEKTPPLVDVQNGHQVACWLYDQAVMEARGQAVGIPQQEDARHA
jgi:peptide/nickel transport system ATP-binding protein/oligopeptide transport system ATP-binding protein